MDRIEQRNKLIDNGEFIIFKYPYKQFDVGDLVSFHLISDVKSFNKQKAIAVVSSEISNNDLLVENDIILEKFFNKKFSTASKRRRTQINLK